MLKYNSKIIIACDFDTKEELFNFLKKMNSKKLFLKLGMQILYANGFEIISDLKNMGHNIFIDLKIYDILNTSKKAIISLAKYKPDFLTIHSLTNIETLIELQKVAQKYNLNLLAVTILTSLDDNDLKMININCNVETEVETLIQNIKKSGIYGVVSSAKEARIVKKYDLVSVAPGIRLHSDNNNDQKRVVSPKEAIKEGADFIVVGRTITNSKNPLEIYEKIEKEL